jgi:peptidylprolyl isomerase
MSRLVPFVTAIFLTTACASKPGVSPAPRGATMAEVLAASSPSDWRALDPENTVYLELAEGRVVIELAPAFAPNHAANVRALAREGYFDGLAVLRSQENYVVQWGDPDADDEAKRRPIRTTERTLAAEFDREVTADLPFTPHPDGDVYAPEVGFSLGFPAARDPQKGRIWLAHCYGMVGAGRGNDAGSGGGAQLYVVIGHAPRHLDRNVTLVGRVVVGMERLSTLPRGKGAMGFYETQEEGLPIVSMRVASDLPETERTNLEVLRTDTATFLALVDSRRNRREEWFLDPSGRIDLCNVPIPVRSAP